MNTSYIYVPQIVVPPLPSKALKRQMPFRADDGIYEEGFIEDRRSALEAFINKIAGAYCHQKRNQCLPLMLKHHIIFRASTRPEREMFAHVPPGDLFEPPMVLML